MTTSVTPKEFRMKLDSFEIGVTSAQQLAEWCSAHLPGLLDHYEDQQMQIADLEGYIEKLEEDAITA